MFRITINEAPTENRWILQGRLVGLWVSELRRSWKKTHRTDNNRKCIVDLNEVTFIDKKGERLLRTMSKEGAQFIATGIYIKHILDQLKPSGKHALLKVISCLFAALLGGVIAPLSYTQASPERPRRIRCKAQPSNSIQPIAAENYGSQFFSEIEEGATPCQLNSQTR